MARKSAAELVGIYNNTMKIAREGGYMFGNEGVELLLDRSEMTDVHLYLPDDVAALAGCGDYPRAQGSGFAVDCVNMDSFVAAEDLAAREGVSPCDVLVLNLANAVSPGGGVKHGAVAQEEDLCRRSTLMLSLESEKASAYYEYNRALDTEMGTNGIIITPKVEVFRDADYVLRFDTFVTAVMTCAAPDLMYGTEGLSDSEYRTMVYDRIMGMLRVAAYEGYRYLVLGAFGCGAFCNDAAVISELFEQAIRDFNCGGMTAAQTFRAIRFAVLSRKDTYNFDRFNERFGSGLCIRPAAPEAEYIFFRHEHEAYGEFSNRYPAPFVLDGVHYAHTEQYIMAKKAEICGDELMRRAILRTDDPEECRQLGRRVYPFERVKWENARFGVLREGLRAKVMQHPDILEKLLSTGNGIIAEASPKDTVWGIGMDAESAFLAHGNWKGRNLLGRALMQVRDELRGGH